MFILHFLVWNQIWRKKKLQTGVLNGVKMTVCGMRSINLNDESMKILGIHFSCNEKLKGEKSFYDVITNIQLVSKLCNLRNLTLKGKIVTLKTIALSKIIFWALIITLPNHVIKKLQKNSERVSMGKNKSYSRTWYSMLKL